MIERQQFALWGWELAYITLCPQSVNATTQKLQCPVHFVRALESSKAQDNLLTIGAKWRTSDWNGVNFDSFRWFTSQPLLHETMYTKTIGMKETLDHDRTVGETYKMAEIIN